VNSASFKNSYFLFLSGEAGVTRLINKTDEKDTRCSGYAVNTSL